MHSPEAAGKISPRAPRVQEVSLEIIFQHLGSSAVEGPERSVRADVNQMNVRRLCAEAPLVEVLAVFVEDLHAMVAAIVYEDVLRDWINRQAVDVVEVRGPLIRRRALHAPIHQEFSGLVEFRDARAVVSVGHEQSAVGEPGEERRPIEVLVICAGLIGCAERLQEFLAVVREDEDGVARVVHHPDALFWVVGIDVNRVRPPEE